MKLANCFILYVLFVTWLECNSILYKKPSSNDYVIKFSEKYYQKLEGIGGIDKYKEIIKTKFNDRLIKGKQKQKEKLSNSTNRNNTLITKKQNTTIKSSFNSTITDLNKKNINETKSQINSTNKLKLIQTNLQRTKKDLYDENFNFFDKDTIIGSNTTDGNIFAVYSGDFVAKERTVKFYISISQECNVLINDTVHYEQYNKNINFIEHLILHNNVDFIDPKAVFSNNLNINFFAYNKKLNMFSVYFDKNEEQYNYTMEYDYLAVNLIKSQKDNNNITRSNNTFLWKFFNENLFKIKQKLNLEFYFSFDKLFENENVTFSIPGFNKTIVQDETQRLVKYSYSGELLPQDVMILDVKFPMYIENCGGVNINVPMIIVGSVFIIFLILVLYLILSSMIFEEY